MANTKSAAKRARQTTRRSIQNQHTLSSLKSLQKKTNAELATKNKVTARAEIQKLVSALDKAAKSGRVHRNAANRRKSSLNKKLVALS